VCFSGAGSASDAHDLIAACENMGSCVSLVARKPRQILSVRLQIDKGPEFPLSVLCELQEREFVFQHGLRRRHELPRPCFGDHLRMLCYIGNIFWQHGTDAIGERFLFQAFSETVEAF
jgi:hypothetical protein